MEPLTTLVKEHFGCAEAPGMLLENEGTNGLIGSHFERRAFGSECMTASAIADSRISVFTIGALESTGWYKIDYKVAEPFYWGKGKGCDFYLGPCFDKKIKNSNFEEFCSPLTEFGCTYHRRYISYCGTNRADTTSYTIPAAWNYWSNNTIVDDKYADNCPC